MSIRSLLFFVASTCLAAQELPVRWDELVASDWKKAIELSHGTCILPISFWKNMARMFLSAPI